MFTVSSCWASQNFTSADAMLLPFLLEDESASPIVWTVFERLLALVNLVHVLSTWWQIIPLKGEDGLEVGDSI